MNKEYITLREFCERTQISASTAYRMIRNGSLPAVKLAGTRNWRIPAEFIPRYDRGTMRICSYQ